MLESNQQPCPRAKGQSFQVAQHPSLSTFQTLQPTRVRDKEAGSWLPTSKRLTGEKVSLGLRKLNWTQVGGYLSSLWPAVVSSGSCTSSKAHNCLLWVNYQARAFGNRSDVLGLSWLKCIEQRRIRRGNQAPLGTLFEATERQGWSLQSICKEAARSFVHLKEAAVRCRKGGQRHPAASLSAREGDGLWCIERWAFPAIGQTLMIAITGVLGKCLVKSPTPYLSTSNRKCHFHSMNLCPYTCKMLMNSTCLVLQGCKSYQTWSPISAAENHTDTSYVYTPFL